MDDLQKEPNPQPRPVPAGPIDKRRITLMALIVFVGVIVLTVVFMFNKPSTESVMGPRMVKTEQPKGMTSIRLSEEKEKAYEEGRRDQAKALGGINNAPIQQPYVPQTPVYASSAPAVPSIPTLQKVAFSDNMIDGGKFGLARDADSRAGRLDSSGIPPVASGGDSVRDSRSAVSEIAQNVLPEGTLIFCALINQLNGDNTGPFKVQVAETVYFPDTQVVAVPQGAILIGEAQKVGAQFQQRLAVSFHSLQIGNKQIRLDKMPGLDQQGAAALTDKVNNHYAQIFGASLAIGAIGGLSQIGNNSYGGLSGYDASTQIRNGISQSTAQSSAQILSHFLNRMPTLIIRPGTPVVVFLTGNLEIPQ